MLNNARSKKILIFDELNTNAAVSITRHLDKLGCQVDLLVPENHPARYSRHRHQTYTYKTPVKDPSLYISRLLSCLQKESYFTVLIFEDHLTEIVCDNIESIQELTKLLVPENTNNMLMCLNKKDSFNFVESLGIPIPKTTYINSAEQIQNYRNAEFPVIIKGEKGTAGLHVRQAQNYDELVCCYNELEDLEKDFEGRPFIQEMVKGNGYVCHALAHKGQLVSLCIHKKVHEIPVSGGITSLGQTLQCDEIKQYTTTILGALGWDGLVKLDFMYNEQTRQFVFIEIDPRISASIDICRVAGTMMIEKSLALLNNKSVDADLNYEQGLVYAWPFPNNFLYHLCTGRVSKNIFNKKYYNDISIRDFKPEIKKIIKTLKITGKNAFKKSFWQGQVHL